LAAGISDHKHQFRGLVEPIEAICVRSRKRGPSLQKQKEILPAKIAIVAG
jgi:hypothetical protein